MGSADETTGLSAVKTEPSHKPRFYKHWAFWMAMIIAVSGGVTGFSLALLYKLPSLPNCPNIFWPTASASLRLYCAELAAKKNTTEDLLVAIQLMDGLPQDHPLRVEADQLIDDWSFNILDLADRVFQEGDLEGAMAIAEKIPNKGPAYSEVNQRIDSWRSAWARAERIYQETISAVEADDLRKAFSSAVKLLNVGNEYWATTKYDELNEIIETTRVDSQTLAEARGLARQQSIAGLLDAIDLLEGIEEDSFLYDQARRLIVSLWDDMLSLGQAALDSGDVDDVIKIANRLPPGTEYQAQADDLRSLAVAVTQAQRGTVADLESAMLQVSDFPATRPLYYKAQDLALRWRLEIQDVQRLSTARRLAAPGTPDAYREAIAEAERIPTTNPRSDEARSAIDGWWSEIYAIEDQPYLDRAEQIARGGDILSLQAAIAEARRIGNGRPLSAEANQRIQSWTRRIQRIQDQPILSEANQFAQSGNLPQAIATAQQISSGRALYDEAQTSIQEWQSLIDQRVQQQRGTNQLRRAIDQASLGTPSSLVSAIQIANQVDATSPVRSQADRLTNQWSETLLQIAQREASVSIERAIAVAELVPPQTTAFAPAQLQLREWRSSLGTSN
ncbi:MAG: chromosome segregation ATPase [Cyanobacteria bacterium J06626_14]